MTRAQEANVVDPRQRNGRQRELGHCGHCGGGIDRWEGDEVWEHVEFNAEYTNGYHPDPQPEGDTEWTPYPRITTFETSLGTLDTWLCPHTDLREGDRIVADTARGGNHVQEVIVSAANDPRGWVFIRDLDDEHVWDPSGGGSWLDEGFYAWSYPTPMHLVIEDD